MSEHNTHEVFNDIVKNLDLGPEGIFEVESIENFKTQLLTCFYGYLSKIGNVDLDDECHYHRICEQLSALVNYDARQLQGLKVNDMLVSSGTGVWTLYHDGQVRPRVNILPDDFHLRGRLSSFMVTEVPDVEIINTMSMASLLDSDALPRLRLGLTALLVDVQLETKEGSVSVADAGDIVGVPFTEADVPLKRVVK